MTTEPNKNPQNDTNSTGTPTPTPSTSDSQTSDIVDILIDQHLDQVQANDFVPVSPADVHALDNEVVSNAATDVVDVLGDINIDSNADSTPITSQEDNDSSLNIDNAPATDLDNLNIDFADSTADSNSDNTTSADTDILSSSDSADTSNVDLIDIPTDTTTLDINASETPDTISSDTQDENAENIDLSSIDTNISETPNIDMPIETPTDISINTPITSTSENNSDNDLSGIDFDGVDTNETTPTENTAEAVVTSNEDMSFDLPDIETPTIENTTESTSTTTLEDNTTSTTNEGELPDITLDVNENSTSNDLNNIQVETPTEETISTVETPSVDNAIDLSLDTSDTNISDGEATLSEEAAPELSEDTTSLDNTLLENSNSDTIDFTDTTTTEDNQRDNLETSTDLSSIDTTIEDSTTDSTVNSSQSAQEEDSPENSDQEDSIDFDALNEFTIPEGSNVSINDLEKAGSVATITVEEPDAQEIVETPVVPTIETPTENVVESSAITEPTPTTDDVGNIQIPNIEDKLNAVAQNAEKIEEGIDLDSLVAPTDSTINDTQNAVASTFATMDTASTQPAENVMPSSKKPLKLAFITMGIIATLGVAYFGYQAVFPKGIGNTPSSDLSTSPTPTIEDTLGDDLVSGDNADLDTGDIIDTTSGNVIDTDSDTIFTDETDTGSTTTTPSRTIEDIKTDADTLASRARKAMINATLAKNGSARMTAFAIQKDIETFIQSLENSSDMNSLEANETTLEKLSERLTSLESKLNGSSN